MQVLPDEVQSILSQAEKVYSDPVIEAFHAEYEELYELAMFCLVVGVPYSEAKNMREIERRAFIEAFNDIQKEQAKAAKRR